MGVRARFVCLLLLMAPWPGAAYAEPTRPVTVTNDSGNPVLMEPAVAREPIMLLKQTELHAAAPRAGFGIDVFVVPADRFLVIETVSAVIRFSPSSFSEAPPGVVDIAVRFREQGAATVTGQLAIPASSSTLPAAPLHGITSTTTSTATETVRVVLRPGSLISWGFTVAGETSAQGTASLSLFGYYVPAGSRSFDR